MATFFRSVPIGAVFTFVDGPMAGVQFTKITKHEATCEQVGPMFFTNIFARVEIVAEN